MYISIQYLVPNETHLNLTSTNKNGCPRKGNLLSNSLICSYLCMLQKSLHQSCVHPDNVGCCNGWWTWLSASPKTALAASFSKGRKRNKTVTARSLIPTCSACLSTDSSTFKQAKPGKLRFGTANKVLHLGQGPIYQCPPTASRPWASGGPTKVLELLTKFDANSSPGP